MNKCLYCGKPVKNKYCGVTCQNKYENSKRADKRYGEIKEFAVTCASCGIEFIVKERSKQFPKKKKYYCSKSCANRRHHSDKTKSKISKTLKTRSTKVYSATCEMCGNVFNKKWKNSPQRFCSISCAVSWRNKYKDQGKHGGRKSAATRIVRSKNEIYFAELCTAKFKNVLTNKPIFNGWDADVIIDDYKVAVLWNGVWHYKKITEKHSVKQVQNRDKIKHKEIVSKGYIPYTIKDMGKANKKFVEEEFEKFLKFTEYLRNI